MVQKMKAYITSIGEPTTDLCEWSLRRNGFETEIVFNKNTTLAQKLKYIYDIADDDFVRIDADVIVNNKFDPLFLGWLELQNHDIWWWQFQVFCWLKLDLSISGGYIKKAAIPHLRNNIDNYLTDSRAETQMSRINEFYEPRRFDTYDGEIIGLHGYKNNLDRARSIKHLRNQLDLYDFEMAERLNNI